MASIMRMVSQWQIELAILSLTVSLGLGLFQLGKLSIAEVLLSLLVVVSFGLFMLVKDIKCSVESLAVSMQGSARQLASIEKRGMYRQLQGHEFVRQLKRWFYEEATEFASMSWLANKLASEVSHFRQSLLRNGPEVSLAVLI